MYLKELLPDCIVAGMTPDMFWHSYPKEIEPYFEAMKRRRKLVDEEHYALYIYISNALNTALSNAFRGKGQKAKELLQEPIMQKYENEHRELTEDEEQAQVALLFQNLSSMQRSFEQSKRGH